MLFIFYFKEKKKSAANNILQLFQAKLRCTWKRAIFVCKKDQCGSNEASCSHTLWCMCCNHWAATHVGCQLVGQQSSSLKLNAELLTTLLGG